MADRRASENPSTNGWILTLAQGYLRPRASPIGNTCALADPPPTRVAPRAVRSRFASIARTVATGRRAHSPKGSSRPPRPGQISFQSIGRTVGRSNLKQIVPCGALGRQDCRPKARAGARARLFFQHGKVGLSVLPWFEVRGWLRSPPSPHTAVRSQAPTFLRSFFLVSEIRRVCGGRWAPARGRDLTTSPAPQTVPAPRRNQNSPTRLVRSDGR